MKEITIKIKSEMENIKNMRNMIGALVVLKGQTLTFANEIKTIISEGITNAIVHGYKGMDDKDILIKVEMDDKGIHIVIIDYGVGILDVNKAREALFSTLHEEERSGIGFTIMELFSTKFDVHSEVDKGTTLDIFKAFE